MDQDGIAFDARERPRPPRREFVATIGTEELGRYAGVGLTLERVIEEELRKVGCVGVSAEPVEQSDDVVIWQSNKVVALVRIGPEGRPVATRLDRPPARPDAPGGATPSAPGGDVESIVGRSLAVVGHFQALRRFAAQLQELCDQAIGEVAPAVSFEPFGPRKPRPRKAPVSRRSIPRRKPGRGPR
jgi:hypothetical protein